MRVTALVRLDWSLSLHIPALRSPCGIGDTGPAAVFWPDRLPGAGKVAAIAKLGPTGSGNSRPQY